MTREEEVKDARHFDVRIVERNIKRGIITRKEYDRFLKSLPDVGDKVAADDSEAFPPEPVAEG
jgi:hypothetical protein